MGAGGGGTQNTVAEPWSGSQPYLRDVMNQAQQLYQTGGAQYYPGQTFVGPTAGQLGAWNTALGYSDQVYGGQNAPKFGEATGALSNVLGGGYLGGLAGGSSQQAGAALNSMLSGTPDYSGLQKSIDAANAPLLRQFEQEILPGLNQKATFYGNPTGGIKAVNQILPELGERMSQNANAAYEQERQRALAAQQSALGLYGQFGQGATQAQIAGAGLFPSLAEAGRYPGQIQEQFANYGAGFQQQALNDQINRFNYYQNLPQQNLQNYSSIINGYGGLGGTQSTTLPQGNRTAGAAGGAIGGAVAGAQIGSVFPGIGTGIGAIGGALIGGLGGYYSDRRLKTDITRIGTTRGGLGVYQFRYKSDPEHLRVGVMADEVRQLFPDAVLTDLAGHDVVNYGAIH